MTTTQMLLTLDKKENEIVEKVAKEMNVSKMNAIKEIILRFSKEEKIK